MTSRAFAPEADLASGPDEVRYGPEGGILKKRVFGRSVQATARRDIDRQGGLP